MKNYYIYILLLTSILTTACNLDKEPYGAISASNIMNKPDESLESLLNGAYSQLKPWSDVMHRCGEYAGDNIIIRGTSTDAFYEFISFARTPNNGRLQNFWDSSYKVIAQTSNILKMIKEGKSKDIDNKLGECYFLRGMMYFYLCRAYGRPYYQNPTTNLGVPIVNGTPEDMFNFSFKDRANVENTYKQIIADLEKSISLFSKNRGNIYGSKEAAKALLSRVYLYMSGTYKNPNTKFAQLAIKYADEVINSKHQLLSREDFMRYNTIIPEKNIETIFAVKRTASEYSGYDHYSGIGGMYARIGGMGWAEMYASAKYIDLLNETGQNDWYNKKIVDARAAFIEPQYQEGGKEKEVFRFIKKLYNKAGKHTGYNYVQAPVKNSGGTKTCQGKGGKQYTLHEIDKEQNIYSINYTQGAVTNTYEGVIDKEIILNRVYPMFYITKCSREGEESHLHSPVIIRLGEVYLNKAEAAAKTGNYAMALTALNTVRERSLPGKGYKNLTAQNAEKLIDKERQLELAFQAERSYDVFRNGGTLTRHYPGAHNPMEDIKATDYRVIYFIPQDAINAYPGTLTQNPTSN